MADQTFLCSKYGERYLYGVNRNTFENEDSISFYNHHFKDVLFEKDNLYIITGTDSGLLVRYLFNSDVPEGNVYIFIELDELVSTIRDELSDLDLSNSIRVCSPDEWMRLEDEFEFPKFLYINSIKLISSFSVIDSFSPEYRILNTKVTSMFSDFQWKNHHYVRLKPFIESRIKNIPFNINPAIKLKNSFLGKTAVILAGGPSLDESFEWVKENKENIVIIAVSRIAPRLREVDIKPHIIISVDPHHVSFNVSKQMLLNSTDVLFVHSNYVSHSLISQWSGTSAYIARNLPWESGLNVENVQDGPGTTVGNNALDIALLLGCEQVLLAGIDLCLSKQGYSHAKGSAEYDSGPRLSNHELTIETYDGYIAETEADFFNSLKGFESQAVIAQQKGIMLFNMSSSAARVDGIDLINFDKLQVNSVDEPVSKTLKDIFPPLSHSDLLNHYTALQKEIVKILKQLKVVRKLAKEALRFNKKLFEHGRDSPDFKYKSLMDKVENKFNSKYKSVADLVKVYDSIEFLKMPPRTREWTVEEIEAAGNTYYGAFVNNADSLIAKITQSKKALDCYCEEINKNPDLNKVYDFWYEEGMPGRAKVFLENCHFFNINLNEEQKQKLKKTIVDFEKTLFTCDNYLKDAFRLNATRYDLQKNFKNNRADRIAIQIEFLRRQENTEQVQDLINLAEGYKAELSGQTDSAIDFYMSVVDSSLEFINSSEKLTNPRLEDALIRLNDIFLSNQDQKNALLVMDVLSEFSDIYRPFYAELLALSGDQNSALELYGLYLKKFPNDYNVMFKLACLYRDMGNPDASVTLLKYINENQPENLQVLHALEASK